MQCTLCTSVVALVFTGLMNMACAASTIIDKQQDWGEGAPNFSAAQPLSNLDGRYDHWRSIGRVSIQQGMTCSGTLIDTRYAPNGLDGPAYVLTSGHCNNLNPDVTLENVAAKGSVSFNYFFDTAEQTQYYFITNINWSTIRGQDISVVELDNTLGQLLNDGITPLKLASQPLPQGRDALIVGAPDGAHIQRMACPQEHSAGIIESMWAWPDQASNRCLDVVSGVSGSPVLDRYTNEVVAVVGTTTRGSGLSRCSTGAPCEIVNGQVNKALNTNYATQVSGVSECFTQGRFNRRNGACSLGPAFTFEPPQLGSYHIKLERDDTGAVIPWQWIETFAVNRPYYRYKYSRTLADCREAGSYSDPVASSESGKDELIRDVRDGAGMYLLCVMGQDQKTSVPGQWDARNARVYWRWMMEGPNQTVPLYNITQADPLSFDIRAFPVNPDLDAYQYKYKAGPPDSTHCQDAAQYNPVQGSTGQFHVSVESGQMKVCLKSSDLAGNPSPIVEFVVPPALSNL